MSREELSELLAALKAAQPRMRAVARQMKNIDDYDLPCRIAASLEEAALAIRSLLDVDDHPAFTANQEEQGTL